MIPRAGLAHKLSIPWGTERRGAELQRVVGEDLKHSISEISALNPSHRVCLHVDKLPHR